MTYSDLLTELEAVSRQAGAAIMEVYHSSDMGAVTKGDGSPVTKADQAAEDLILPVLAGIAPDIPVISEENADSHKLTAPDCFFLVDPLDGTKEFLRQDGQGSFTVNIAIIEKGEPVLGLVFAPALDRLFLGAKGQGAFEIRAGRRLGLSVRAVPQSGAVAVASKSHRDQATDAWLSANGIADTTSIGSSLKFCLLAAGEADAYPRFGPTMEWDTGAGDAVLRAAGGRVLNPEGSVFEYGKPEYRNGAFIALGLFEPLNPD